MISGISTAWQSGQVSDGNRLLDLLGETGLSGLELDYRVSQQTLLQMWQRLRSDEFQVVSVHNYCPTPPGYEGHPHAAALFNPASLDVDERKLAVKFGQKSIQLAAELEATLVVFHMGAVDMACKMRELFDLYEYGGADSAPYLARLAELQKIRAGKIGEHMTPLLHTIEALHQEAWRFGVRIGIENRYRLSQIPFGDEFDLIFTEFAGGQLRYWHDVGHAEVFSRLGIHNHESDFLERFKDHLAGMHIHDIAGFNDHLAPGMGDFDFSRLRPYLQEDSLRIIEAHDPVDLEQMRAGIVRLREAEVL